MKKNVFGLLQKIGKSLMLPIAVLPIAGIFLGVGECLTNSSMIYSLHLETFLGEHTLLYQLFMILKNVGQMIFNNLPLLFSIAVASGMAKKSKEVAGLSAIIAFFTMHATINTCLTLTNSLDDEFLVLGSIADICGIQSLQMGAFGGIIVGLGVSYLHNRFYQIQLPEFLSFFEGERFIPIISTLAYIAVGGVMFLVWPTIQNGILYLGTVIANSSYMGTLVYGIIKRVLVPFGLHHVFYIPFYQTALGGTMTINGVVVNGAQNIFFAQLSDPNLTHFSVEATRFFSGEYLIMLFGLPGGALAMYHCAYPESKKTVKSLFLSSALTSILTGITEPIEFTFVFVAPVLFFSHVLIAGSAFVVGQLLKVAIGYTFSCGLIDFTVFGILQGNAKTNWIFIPLIGILYFFIYYFVFTFLIKKYDLKTPGRQQEQVITIFNKQSIDYSFDHSYIDPQVQMIIKGLGGRNNFYDLDCCITRLRVIVHDPNLISDAKLKQAGAAAVIVQGNAIQIIFGPKASSIKTKINDYLDHVPMAYDEQKTISYQHKHIELSNIVDGVVIPIEECIDDLFSRKVLGDGILIEPIHGLVVAPCDGKITMIYPTKHAIGMQIEEGIEILIHFGINTVALNGEGFELLVHQDQVIQKGDLLWNADLTYIKENALDDKIALIFTKIPEHYLIDKHYGQLKIGEPIITLKTKGDK